MARHAILDSNRDLREDAGPERAVTGLSLFVQSSTGWPDH
jgi:hypothetical protein